MSEKTSILWNEKKLEELIRNKVEESLTLGYRIAGAIARDDKAELEITKDVSALANSAGGVLIYGLAQFQDAASKHLPEKIDPINKNDFSKEWLENVISQIRPRILGVVIYPVPLASAPDHVAYVVEIPQGGTAHQASDLRYYRRHDFQSIPMFDHEVRDVMNRKAHPHLAVSAEFIVYPQPNEEGSAGALVVEIRNESDVFARYVALVVHSPIRVRGRLINYSAATLDDGEGGHSFRLLFSNHDAAPLFPRGILKQVYAFKFGQAMSPEPKKQLDHFRWGVFADSMPMQSGSFIVEEIFKKMD